MNRKRRGVGGGGGIGLKLDTPAWRAQRAEQNKKYMAVSSLAQRTLRKHILINKRSMNSATFENPGERILIQVPDYPG